MWETVPDEEDKIIDERKEEKVLFAGMLGGEVQPTGNNSVYLESSNHHVPLVEKHIG